MTGERASKFTSVAPSIAAVLVIMNILGCASLVPESVTWIRGQPGESSSLERGNCPNLSGKFSNLGQVILGNPVGTVRLPPFLPELIGERQFSDQVMIVGEPGAERLRQGSEINATTAGFVRVNLNSNDDQIHLWFEANSPDMNNEDRINERAAHFVADIICDGKHATATRLAVDYGEGVAGRATTIFRFGISPQNDLTLTWSDEWRTKYFGLIPDSSTSNAVFSFDRIQLEDTAGI